MPHMGRFKPHQVVRIHIITPRADIQHAMESAIREITSALREQHVQPSGPFFSFHHRAPTDTFDFDLCFPVKQELAPSGRMENASLPEFDVVRTAFHGPYDELRLAWPEFHRMVEAQGHRITEQAIEQYSRGPNDVPDPKLWQTDLMFVLAAGEVSKERLL